MDLMIVHRFYNVLEQFKSSGSVHAPRHVTVYFFDDSSTALIMQDMRVLGWRMPEDRKQGLMARLENKKPLLLLIQRVGFLPLRAGNGLVGQVSWSQPRSSSR